MKIKMFTLRFSAELGKFDDEEMVEFLREKEVLSIETQFFIHDHHPYYSLLLSYREQPWGSFPQKSSEALTLSDEYKKIYELLREWRNAKADKEGFPPFIIFSNRQLSYIAKAKPTGLELLQKIEKVGATKASKYGPEIFKILDSAQKESAHA